MFIYFKLVSNESQLVKCELCAPLFTGTSDHFNALYARNRIKQVACEQRTWTLILRGKHLR